MAEHNLFILLLLTACVTVFVDGYPFYADNIPNGREVRHPCTDNIWQGVGHLSPAGGGLRNPFGEAFALGGRTWNEGLCRADSDQDGLTNGEELGDPNCVWQMGDAPQTNITSHPGICEPVESPECMAFQGLTCDDVPAPYDCPASREPHVEVVDFTFPETRIPAKETNYFCKTFKFPSDQPYHLIAIEPIIDNINVLHHMVMFGCSEEIEDSEIRECGMGDQRCRSNLASWSVGIDGYCLQDTVGIAIGKGSSFPSVSITIHWNNPHLSPNYTDASGLRLFYTPQLRPYVENMAVLGQRMLSVPPMTQETVVMGTCPAECTDDLPMAINITSAALHMHYLGISGSIEVYRDNVLKQTILGDRYYDYESPALLLFNPPLVVEPGDELRTKCVYNSKDGTRERTETAFFGPATKDEMCFAYMGYYFPDTNINSNNPIKCVQQGSVHMCKSDIMNPETCDVCSLYIITMDINQMIIDSGRCQTSCDEGCSELLGINLINSPCAQAVFAFMVLGGTVPEEMRALTDAYLMCLTDLGTAVDINGRSLLSGFSSVLPDSPGGRLMNTIPTPQECGLIDPPPGGAVTLSALHTSLITVLVVAAGIIKHV